MTEVEQPQAPCQPLPAVPDIPHSKKRTFFQFIGVFLVGLVAALLIRVYVAQAYMIPSPSMTPTLQVDDRMAVWKPIGLEWFNRGDVIVFKHPVGTSCGFDSDAPDVFVKRVIGLPGETVTAPGGKVEIDGEPLDEPYLADGMDTSILEPMVVPKGEVLVLGDNRVESLDGRCFGTIGNDLVVGRAMAKVWPLNRIGWL